jgi:hypothetical protein
MDLSAVFSSLISAIISGGPGAIMAMLVGAIVFLIWDRIKLLGKIDQKEEKIEKIIDEYYKGNLSITEALNGLRIVLAEIKGKL